MRKKCNSCGKIKPVGYTYTKMPKLRDYTTIKPYVKGGPKVKRKDINGTVILNFCSYDCANETIIV